MLVSLNKLQIWNNTHHTITNIFCLFAYHHSKGLLEMGCILLIIHISCNFQRMYSFSYMLLLLSQYGMLI